MSGWATRVTARLLVVLVGGAVGNADAGDDRLLRALVQAIATALHGRQELLEIDLERREDPVGPVLHLEPRLARLPARILDDVLRLPLGELHDLGLRCLADGLLACLPEEAVGLALRLGEHLLALLDDPARLLDLLGDRRPHLVEDVVDLLAVDANLVGERNGLRVVHEVVQLVDQNQYVHRFAEFTEETGWVSRAARTNGASSAPVPPRVRARAAAALGARRYRRSSAGRSLAALREAAGPRRSG